MTAAWLLSAVEPILRSHHAPGPGDSKADRGLPQRDDPLDRVIDVWAAGEASASLGLAAARVLDELELPERRKDDLAPLANVLGPACTLWNTGHGANMMREAASLMGASGTAEGGLRLAGRTWIDAELEATGEGSESVERRRLSAAMTDEGFLAQFAGWIREMREIASRRPGTGACTLATAMELWLWTLSHVRKAADADGGTLYHDSRPGVTFPLADALCWLLASRCQILDVNELEARGREHPALAEALPGVLKFFTDLCHAQAARGAGEVGRISAELVFGYRRHPAWDAEGCASCYQAEDLEALEEWIPGLASSARSYAEVIEADGSHRPKAGPCARFDGLDAFTRMRTRLDRCLTGARLARERAAAALRGMIAG
jgi:hypothetical protein